MSDYQIITDSTCDLTQELVDELGVAVMPMDFTIGQDVYKDYPDERDISSHEFYRRVSAGEPCMTNQISPTVFTEAFEPYLRQGTDLLYLAFSSGLSGTYNNSVVAVRELADKYPERKIAAVDTLCASVGEGLMVWYAAKKKQSGASMDEVKDWVEHNRLRLHHWFTVDDLDHLRRGGRISGAAALVGTMLGIKPVLHVDYEGRLIVIDKVRGRRQSLDDLVKHMEQTVEDPAEQMIFIGQGDCMESAEYVREQVRQKFGVTQFSILPVGPVVGSHTGTGIIELFFLGKDREFGLHT